MRPRPLHRFHGHGRTLAAAALCWLAAQGTCTPTAAKETGYTARVVGISDGDTITVLVDKQPIKIRVAEIDCPESGQDFGNRAKQAASRLVHGKTVRVVPTARDRYGRTVAEVYLPDGRSLGRELVRQGLAWQFLRYSKSADLARLQKGAKRRGRGLWAHQDSIPPWQYRAEKKGRRAARAARAGSPGRKGRTPQPVAAPVGAPAGGPVRGNRRSHVYHLPGCPSYERVAPRNRVPFPSEKLARAAGFRRAGNCR